MDKKVMFLIVIIIFLTVGCSKKIKYEQYEHVDLSNSKIESYSFYNEETKSVMEYALSPIESHNNITLMGLYYRISKKEYILLDNIENMISSKFYENNNHEKKLYIGTFVLPLYEYTLNESKIEKKELNFDTTPITSNSKKENSYVYSFKITNVEDEYIYFDANYTDEKINPTTKIKCSLVELICDFE